MKISKLLVAGAAATLLLTGCSASEMSAGDSAGSAPMVDMADAADMDWSAETRAEMGDGAAAEGPAPAQDELPSDTDYLVRWASMDLKVEDVTEAATQVRAIASNAGGMVTSEHFDERVHGSMAPPRNHGMIRISVPSDRLDAVLDELAEVGEARSRSSESMDVKDEYIDVEARITTLTASIERMRDLMTQTTDIKQIIELETALSARQADLDSLQARLNDLQGRIAMSPVDVSMSTGDDPFYEEPGILGAFKKAWNDFKASATVLVRATGALLPWLLVGGLAAWALLWGYRRTRARRTAASAPAADETSEPAPTTDTTPDAANPQR